MEVCSRPLVSCFSDTYAMSGSPSLTRSLSPPNVHIDMETGSKYYHLVSSTPSPPQLDWKSVSGSAFILNHPENSTILLKPVVVNSQLSEFASQMNQHSDRHRFSDGVQRANGSIETVRLFQVKPHEESKGEDRGNKMVSEIYLTRLLATKVLIVITLVPMSSLSRVRLALTLLRCEPIGASQIRCDETWSGSTNDRVHLCVRRAFWCECVLCVLLGVGEESLYYFNGTLT